MDYREAKQRQIEEFKKGQYFVLREESDSPGTFYLIPATSRQVAKDSLAKDVIAEVKRMPARLRVYSGGKD